MRAPEIDLLPPEVVDAIEEARRRRAQTLSPLSEGLTWLAVVPQWTEQLADALEFPTHGAPLEDVVRRAGAAGLCERRAGRAPAGATFWMPEYARVSLAQSLPDVSTTSLSAAASDIADRIGRLADPTPAAGLELWRRLAEAGPKAPQLLTEQVIACAAADDTAAALEWLTAAEPLALTLRGELEEALVRNRRRVGLVHRRRLDEQALLHNVVRADAVDALRTLIKGPDRLWATNFVGLGGVGKTMLIRYLSVVLADEMEERPLLVGRVDFDHLDAKYPWERPAELLVALADALTIHSRTSTQDSLLDDLIEQVRRLDHTYRGSGPIPVRGKEFEPVLDAFQGFVQALPGRVVLVLDTCEELAKLHGPAEDHTSVDRTFEILEEVHDRVHELRVVLAGRRLLATGGEGWEHDSSRGRPASLASLKHRTYLRLHELRGFDEKQGVDLLRGRGRMPEVLEQAILGASKELGRVAGVPGGGEGPADDRYNPYDLKLFVGWYEETGGRLHVAEIGSGGRNGYVKARIIDRITEPELPPALPVVALLGRFDFPMLKAGLPDRSDAAGAFEALAHQEWIDADLGREGSVQILQVEPQLLGRLRAWYANSEPDALGAAAARLGPQLAAMVSRGDVEQLGVERLEVATRCLDADDVVLLWARLPEAIAPSRAWGVVEGAAQRVLSDEGPAAALADPAARAAVLSGRATAYLHHGRRVDARATWEEVRRLTDGLHDDPVPALHGRARVMARVCSENPPEWAPELPDPARGEQAVATALAALESALERGDGAAAREWPALQIIADWADAVRNRVSPALAAAVRCAHARWAAWAGEQQVAEAAFLDAAAKAPEGRTDQQWADWIAPSSVADRVTLERMVHEADAGVGTHGPTSIPDLSTVDGDRVAAITLELARAGGVPPPWPVDSLLTSVPELREQPSCRAHLRVPPLFVALARWQLSRGLHEPALDLLQRVGSRAAGTRGSDAASSIDADWAGIEELRIARAMRLERGYVQRAQREVESAEGRAYATAIAALALCGPPSSYPPWRPSDDWAWTLARPPQVQAGRDRPDERPGTVHVSTYDHSQYNRARAAVGKPALHPKDSVEIAEYVADLREFARRGRAETPVFEPDWLAIAARQYVAGDPPPDAGTLPGLVAEVLTAEAELAGLRAPEPGARALRHAAGLFATADDGFGEFRAAAAATLCDLRHGDRKAAEALLRERVEPAFARLVEQAGWPPLDPTDVSLSKAAGGWLHRVRTARTWATGAEPWPSAEAPAELLRPPDEAMWRPERPRWRTRRFAMQVGIGVLVLAAAAVAAVVDVFAGVGVLGSGAALATAAATYARLLATVGNSQISVLSGDAHHAILVVGRFVVGHVPKRSGGIKVRLPEGTGGLRLAALSFSLVLIPGTRKGAFVALDVDEQLQAEPWETIVVAPFTPPPEGIPDFWRRRLSARAETPPSPATGVVVAGSDRWSALAEQAWLAQVRNVGPSIMRAKVETEVLHLIGAPALLNGWHLRLDDELRAFEAGSTTKAAVDAQVLLAPEMLDLTRSPLVIVQGTPGVRDDEFQRGLRSFAAQMNAAGARAVLVIPGVDPTAAAAAAAAAAKRFRANLQPARADLVAIAREARLAVVHSLEEGSSKDKLLTSLDVCLFLTEPALEPPVKG